MRVLIVVHGFPPLAEGGSEVYVHALATTLARRHGDEVLVLTREANPAAREYAVRTEARDGLRIVWINNTFAATRSFEDSYRNDAVASIARSVIDKFRPDVAHVHHLTCLSTLIVPALAERGVPVFFTLHDYWLMCHRGQLLDREYRLCAGPGDHGCGRCIGAAPAAAAFSAGRLLRPLWSALPPAAVATLRSAADRTLGALSGGGRQADAEQRRARHMREIGSHVTRFLSPSEYLRRQFVDAFGIPGDRIVTTRLGFDHRLFGAGRSVPQARDRSKPLRLGFVGTLMVSKAPHLLLEAAAAFGGGVSVDLYGAYSAYHGDDTYRERIAPLLQGGDVRHHGAVPHSSIPEALASLDALVVPSIWPENSPLVVQEAFLAGIPVIASRIGGIPEFVEDGRNGLLFEPGDADGLRRAIARVVSEPDLLDRLRRGVPRVRTIEEDAASTRAMYEAACALPSRNRELDSEASTAIQPPQKNTRTGLAAVVLNYRTPVDTSLAVRSLLASRRSFDDIVVVDNDAPEHGERSAQPVRTHAADRRVRSIRTGGNLGFSGGMNAGIAAALARGCDAVLLVNSDAILPPGCVERLEAALNGTHGAGIAGPAIAWRSAPGICASLGLSYNRRTGRMREERVGTSLAQVKSLVASGALPSPCDVDGVSGCLMLVKREVFEKVGMLDQDYFFSFEDLDFCLRARAAGYRTIVVPDTVAYHEGSGSIGRSSPARFYFAARNHLLLSSRVSPAAPAARSFCQRSAIVAFNLAHALKSRGGSLRGRVGAVLLGTADYLAGRYGPARSFRTGADVSNS